MRAPAGAIVALYVDLVSPVAIGDIIATRSGRRYGVMAVRVQERGKHAGRQHLRATVLERDGELGGGCVVHRIRWYRRDRASGGVKARARR